jgi:hypothetical protein
MRAVLLSQSIQKQQKQQKQKAKDARASGVG